MRLRSQVICSVYEVGEQQVHAKLPLNPCWLVSDAYSAGLRANRLCFAGAMRNGKNVDTRSTHMVNPRFGNTMPTRTFTPVTRARQPETVLRGSMTGSAIAAA
jgi:hypothetical protein